MRYKMNLVTTDAKNKSEQEIETDVNCSIRLINNKYLRAIAKIEYMGVTINDIKVTERRGELKIEYPKNKFIGKDGQPRESSIVFPNMRELGSKFNHIIQQEYARTAYEKSGNPALKVISSMATDEEISAA